jgi:hypothetical protein
MKKLALLFAIVATTTIANTDNAVVKNVNNVTVSINDYSVEITKSTKHIFSQDCSDFTCKLFTPIVPNPHMEQLDGYIVESPVIKQVSLSNASSFRTFDDDTIVFIVNKASVSGLYSRIEHYTIDTYTGSVSVNINERDVYQHGLPSTKKTVAWKPVSLDYETTVKF